MAQDAQHEPTEIRCPHCKKTFQADLMAGGAERYRGFKCPHCRLFVPAAHGEDQPLSRDPDAAA